MPPTSATSPHTRGKNPVHTSPHTRGKNEPFGNGATAAVHLPTHAWEEPQAVVFTKVTGHNSLWFLKKKGQPYSRVWGSSSVLTETLACSVEQPWV